MNNFDIPLLTQVAVLNGADVKESDSASNILQAWIRAEGGTPMNSDTPNDLLRRLCLARGVTPQPGDSNSQLLQRMAGKPSGYSKWDCLQSMLGLSHTLHVDVPRNIVISDLTPTGFTVSWSAPSKDENVMSIRVAHGLDFTTFTPGLEGSAEFPPTPTSFSTEGYGITPGSTVYVELIAGAGVDWEVYSEWSEPITVVMPSV